MTALTRKCSREGLPHATIHMFGRLRTHFFCLLLKSWAGGTGSPRQERFSTGESRRVRNWRASRARASFGPR
jgi:hypothetical protein